MTHHPLPLTALVLAATLASAPARALDAPLAADSHVSASLPANNFGALPTLNVGGGSAALLRFDLATLPAATTAAKLVRATLVLYVNRVGVAGAVDLLPVNSAWTEAGVSAATMPASGGITLSNLAVPATGQYMAVDVTAQVKSWISNPASNNGWAIAAATGAPATVVFFDSKENTATGHVARLDLTLADQGPAGLQGATGAQGPVGATGAQGPAGAKGPAGAAGPSGLMGLQGLPGPTGAMGLQGPAGLTGATGAQGPQGPIGATGPQGPAGPASGIIASVNMQFSQDDRSGWTRIEDIGDDICINNIPLGFTYNGFGASTSTVSVSSNGVLFLSSACNAEPSNTINNTKLPATISQNAMLFFFWDDLKDFGSGEFLEHATFGQAGGRVFNLYFRSRLFAYTSDGFSSGCGTDAVNVMVSVHESSGLIKATYSGMSGCARIRGSSATFGLQTTGGANAKAFTVGVNSPVLDDNASRQSMSFHPAN